MRLLPIAALLLAPTLAPTPIHAQSAPPCAPRDRVTAHLAERYGEARQALGLAANNAVVELFANPETGSWTITGTLPSGLTCLIASGEAYQALAETLKPGDGA